MSVHWHSYPSLEEAAGACANHVAALLEEVLSGESPASLAVSGQAIPALLYQSLAARRLDWSRVHLFWVDERAVPPTDAQSCHRVVEQNLIQPARIPRRNVHRIPTELRPDSAARRYVEELLDFFGLERGEIPHFDVMLRGLGADGHTAGLFPGEPLLDDREGIAAAVYVESLGQWWITLLPAVLLAARHSVFLTSGVETAAAVRAVFHEPYNPKLYPAQTLSHHGRRVTWFLDDGAASLMD